MTSPLLAALLKRRFAAGVGPMPQWQVAVFEALSPNDQFAIAHILPLANPAIWLCLERIVETLRVAESAPGPGPNADIRDAFSGLRRFHGRVFLGLEICSRARRLMKAGAEPPYGNRRRCLLRWLRMPGGGRDGPPTQG